MRQQQIDLGTRLRDFHPSDIKTNMEERLRHERLARHFSVDLNVPELRSDRFLRGEVVKVDFPTMRRRYPRLYRSDFYRVALVTRPLRLADEDVVGLLDRLVRFKSNNSVDRLVAFSADALPPALSSVLKREGIQLITIDKVNLSDSTVITNFIQSAGPFSEQTVYLNILCELLMKRLRKLFHLVLSEVAAPIYDEHYGEGRPATHRIKEKEEAIIGGVVDTLSRKELAIDVGCGTGRHSLALARSFSTTVGFDFSPLMIEEAEKNRRESKLVDRVEFHISDVEYESLPGEDSMRGEVDFICASFGMGSFVENTDRLARKFATWLRPGGKAVISFYNAEPATRRLKPDWRTTALAATVDPDAETLRVELAEEATFSIYCKAYTPELRSKLERYLQIERTIHFPTTLSLMPADMVRSQESADFFGKIDDLLSEDPENSMGTYVTLVCSKLPAADVNVDSAREELSALGFGFSTIEHGPVFTAKEARQEILQSTEMQEEGTLFLKAVVYHVGGERLRKAPITERQFALVILPWDSRVDENELAKALGVSRGKVEGADREALFQLGFPLGGVGPFGLRHTNTRRFVQKACASQTPTRVVFGSGSNLSSMMVESPNISELFRNFEQL